MMLRNLIFWLFKMLAPAQKENSLDFRPPNWFSISISIVVRICKIEVTIKFSKLGLQ